jgi:CheY-like chemotaxis protein
LVARLGVIVAHDEESIVDLLRGLFDAHGYAVDGFTSFDDTVRAVCAGNAVVVTAWDKPLGQQLYQWIAAERRDLRHRLIFIVDEVTDATADGYARGRIIPLHDLAGLIEAIGARHERLRTLPPAPTRRRVLLAEDDPEQRSAIAEILSGAGFEVDAVGGGREAISRLEGTSFDAVLSDWQMPEGSGIELYAWVSSRRPELLGSLVFLTGGDVTAVRTEVAPVPVLPKGQDSPTLLALLRAPRGSGRIAAGTPTHGYTVEAVLPTGLMPRRAAGGDDDEATMVDDIPIVQEDEIRGTTSG